MKVEIERTNGLAVYEVPVLGETETIMDILDYIYANLDHSLAYYRHSSCCQAICGRCSIKLDGIQTLACAKEIDPNTEKIRLSPANGRVVRDLIVVKD